MSKRIINYGIRRLHLLSFGTRVRTVEHGQLRRKLRIVTHLVGVCFSILNKEVRIVGQAVELERDRDLCLVKVRRDEQEQCVERGCRQYRQGQDCFVISAFVCYKTCA